MSCNPFIHTLHSTSLINLNSPIFIRKLGRAPSYHKWNENSKSSQNLEDHLTLRMTFENLNSSSNFSKIRHKWCLKVFMKFVKQKKKKKIEIQRLSLFLRQSLSLKKDKKKQLILEFVSWYPKFFSLWYKSVTLNCWRDGVFHWKVNDRGTAC